MQGQSRQPLNPDDEGTESRYRSSRRSLMNRPSERPECYLPDPTPNFLPPRLAQSSRIRAIPPKNRHRSTRPLVATMEDRSTSDTTDEHSPLLGPKPDNVNDGDHHRRRVILVSFAMVILVDFAAFFLEAPQTKILEGIVCRRYYDDFDASTLTTSSQDDHECTARPVQAELATIVQMLNTFNRLPGLLLAIPYGIAADRYGRRPVLLLAILGALLQDVICKTVLWQPDAFGGARAAWWSSLGMLAGGGDAVASAMIFLVVADVAPPSQRANLFFLLTACGLVGEVVATPISALLMARDPWIPYCIYTLLTLLGGLVPLVFLPETLQRTSPETQGRVCDSSREEDDSEEGQESPPRSSEVEATTLTSLAARFRPLLRQNIIAVLSAFFVAALGRQSTSFFLQYIRQRFDWTYEKASILITLRAAVNLALLLVGLPALNKVLDVRKMAASSKDLMISRLSVAAFALGSLIVAAAPVVVLTALGIVVFALGSGFAPAARSLATAFCQQTESGLLYSALAITQSIGSLVAGPLLTLSFRWSLGFGVEWTGIPFLVISGLFGCGLLALSFVHL